MNDIIEHRTIQGEELVKAKPKAVTITVSTNFRFSMPKHLDNPRRWDNSMDQNLSNGHASAPQTVPAGFEKPSSPPPPPPELVTPPPPPEDFLPPPPEDFPPPPEDLPPPPPPSNSQPPPPPAQLRKIKPKKTSPDSKPLSVEEILRKKKRADEAAAKVRAHE